MNFLRTTHWLTMFLLTAGIARGFDFGAFARASAIPVFEAEILFEIPHDTTCFTQGLAFRDGILFESTGRYGMSLIRKLDARTGEVLNAAPLPENLFGEGLTLWRDYIIQLTWQEKTALVYRQDNLELVRTFGYETEGWGLTCDSAGFYLTDGSPLLYKRKFSDFSRLGTTVVTIADQELSYLNELEYADGSIYANLLGLDYLVQIDPESGRVVAVMDASQLRARANVDANASPLNGIAFDPKSKNFYLTGKLWPAIYCVRWVRSF